jgi:hypothetical protein
MAELQGFTFLLGGLLGAGGVGNDALTLSGIASGSPVCGTATLTQNHDLAANSLATGSPVVGSASLSQNHDLAATGLVAGSPVLQGVTLSQDHAFAPSGLATGSPVCGQPVLSVQSGAVELSLSSITGGLAVLGQPELYDIFAAETVQLRGTYPALSVRATWPQLTAAAIYQANSVRASEFKLTAAARFQTNTLRAEMVQP